MNDSRNDSITYTESALAEKFETFFKEYKDGKGQYSYVDKIDQLITSTFIIEIDYNDFDSELREIADIVIIPKIHFAIYRAICSIFGARYHSDVEMFKRNNLIKFTIKNRDRFKGTFGDPALIYLENDDDGKFAGDQKIGNVASQLQKDDTYVTLRETNELLLYNGMIYSDSYAESKVKAQTEKLIPNCTKHHRIEVIEKIKAQTFTDNGLFDIDPNTITVPNGILDWYSMKLSSHTPKNLSRVLIPTEFKEPKWNIKNDTIFADIEKNLQHTLFWKFLKSSFTVKGNLQRESLETVLEIMASPLVKHPIDDKSFMFLGSGDNGKSICLGYMQELYGKENGSSISLQDIADDRFLRANLDGKSFNIFSDLEKNELKHTGKIKAISSGESIEVQKKNKQGYTMVPFCKLIFSCNRFPRVFDQSQGFFRRWVIVQWLRNFEKDSERNSNLKDELADNQEEKSKVFSCLVYLARYIHQQGKFTHTKPWKDIQNQWNKNADPIDDFDTNFIKDSDLHKSKRDTYQFYKKVTLEKGDTPVSMGQFAKMFVEYHDEDRIEMGESGHRRTERVWLNIDFIVPKQSTLKETDNT